MTKKSRVKKARGSKSVTGTAAAPRKAGELDEATLEEVSGGLNPQPLPPGGMQASPWAVNVSSANQVMGGLRFQFNKKPGG